MKLSVYRRHMHQHHRVTHVREKAQRFSDSRDRGADLRLVPAAGTTDSRPETGREKPVPAARGVARGPPPEENDEAHAETLKSWKLQQTCSQHEFTSSPHLLGRPGEPAGGGGGGGGEGPVRSGHWAPRMCSAPVKTKPL